MKAWANKLPAVLFGAATIAIVSTEFSLALEPREINQIAEDITVIIDGQYPGSGVIINRVGNTYTVLTAGHVVETEDKYEIVTGDGERYPVNYHSVVHMDGVDLAVIQFLSSQNYPVAKLGDSDQIAIGDNVYIGGFPKPGQEIPSGTYQFILGSISSRPQTRDGYTLAYTNITRSGMSGGPVLDDNGRLVGIHGRAESEFKEGAGQVKVGFNLGIPINTFLPFAETIGLDLSVTTEAPPVIDPPPQSIAYDNVFLAKTLESKANEVAVHPDGDTIITSYGSKIQIGNRRSGKLIQTLKGHSGEITAIAISPDGKLLVSASKDNRIKIWTWPGGNLVTTIEEHSKNVNGVAFSPDGKTIVSGSDDKTVRIFQIPTGEEIESININSKVNAVAVTPDGRTIVSGSRDGKIKLWDFHTQEPLDDITEHSESVNSLAISSDGQTIVSGSRDKTIRVWDIANLERIEPINIIQLGEKVDATSISPDGKTIVSATDKRIKLWELETGKLIFDLGEKGSRVAFSPDGRTVVDNVIRIWRVPGRQEG